MRILVVCLGNICRSPAGEGVLRVLCEDLDIEIDSAGLSDWHVGGPPYGPMVEAAAERRLELSGLRARQVQVSDFHDFDLILAMDDDNLAGLGRLRPANATAELRMFDEMGPVPDPYYTREFDAALDQIERAAKALVPYLRQKVSAVRPNSR